MWDGITYVDQNHNPIISEGKNAARVIVTNAGPWTVRLVGWPVTNPDEKTPPEMSCTANGLQANRATDDGPLEFRTRPLRRVRPE
jgi:hypothetical protein